MSVCVVFHLLQEVYTHVFYLFNKYYTKLHGTYCISIKTMVAIMTHACRNMHIIRQKRSGDNGLQKVMRLHDFFFTCSRQNMIHKIPQQLVNHSCMAFICHFPLSHNPCSEILCNNHKNREKHILKCGTTIPRSNYQAT